MSFINKDFDFKLGEKATTRHKLILEGCILACSRKGLRFTFVTFFRKCFPFLKENSYLILGSKVLDQCYPKIGLVQAVD
jgi:hypothetical protein